MQATNVVFVCLGNICRSPLADAVLRHKAEQRGVSDRIHVESRGVGDWHVGEPADRRMRKTASGHGVRVDVTAEVFVPADYEQFDLILSMDTARQGDLERRAPSGLTHKVVPFRTFDPEGDADDDVPDPYYGGDEGFEDVFRIVDRTCDVLLDRLLDGTWRDVAADR